MAGWTLESMVADLPNGIVYLYYFHQFDKPVMLNVADELANPRIGGDAPAISIPCLGSKAGIPGLDNLHHPGEKDGGGFC